MPRRHSHGFTLIEAMTVVAILAVALALGLPAFSGTLERQRLATSLHLLTADMASARSSAIMRREQIVVCPGRAETGCAGDHDWSGGWLVFRDPDGNRRPDAPGDVLRTTDAPAGGAERLRLTSTRPWLRYQANGMAAHSNLSVNACARGLLRGKVVVNRLGRVRSERPRQETACP
ncbi:GspH/FimT family pseudopilin [Luteimonas sp. A501]